MNFVSVEQYSYKVFYNYGINKMRITSSLFIATLSLFIAFPAIAHTDVVNSIGFIEGLTHPFTGLDHILAMISVGVIAHQFGSRNALYFLISFLLFMLIGGFIGASSIRLPLVELGIIISVIALGMSIALGLKLSLSTSLSIISLFAIFHGHAHGTEMPIQVNGFAYVAGFIVATTFLLLTGTFSSIIAGKVNQTIAPIIIRIFGGFSAAVGASLLVS